VLRFDTGLGESVLYDCQSSAQGPYQQMTTSCLLPPYHSLSQALREDIQPSKRVPEHFRVDRDYHLSSLSCFGQLSTSSSVLRLHINAATKDIPLWCVSYCRFQPCVLMHSVAHPVALSHQMAFLRSKRFSIFLSSPT